jgi:nucleotide-binding universal stress UspA family protein
VPVTLAEGSGAAVAVAFRLAEDLSATLVLLHVVPEGGAAEIDAAKIKLQQLAEKTHLSVPIECVVSTGHAARQIVVTAIELKVDTLVMCTHGYHGWFGLSHRHTVREVLGRVHCPVWLISPSPVGDLPTLSVLTKEEERQNFPRAGRTANLFPFPASLRTLLPAG